MKNSKHCRRSDIDRREGRKVERVCSQKPSKRRRKGKGGQGCLNTIDAKV